MSDFLDIDYRMTGIPSGRGDFDLDERGNVLDQYENLPQDLDGQLEELKEARKRGELNVLPPTYKSGNPRAIQQGTFIQGQQTRGDKTRRFSGIVVDRGNVYDRRMNVFFVGKDKDTQEIVKQQVKSVKRSNITAITPPKTLRKQTKPQKNKKTAPQKIQRSELKSGGQLAKAKGRDELKTGKPTPKGRARIVDERGGVYTEKLDKSYLKRNIRK